MNEQLITRLEEIKRDAEARRDALRLALRERRVGDPVSASIAAIFTVKGLIALGVSVALSVGTGLLIGALTPRPQVTRGGRAGEEFLIQRAALGVGIPEIYGDDPGDGLGGGVKVAPIIAWLSRTAAGYVVRKHVTVTRGEGGKGGPRTPDTETITYDLDVLLLWGRGPLTLKRLNAATDIIYDADPQGSRTFYQAEAGGNTLTGGAGVVSDAEASGGQAVDVPPGGSLRFNSVGGSNIGIILEFYYKADSAAAVQFTWVGAAGTAIFNDTLNAHNDYAAHGYYSAPFRLASGSGNSVKILNQSGVTIRFDRLGVRTPAATLGITNPGIPPDDDYDPFEPPDPNTPYTRPEARTQGGVLIDADELALTGTLSNGAGFAHREGNGTELPDPIVQGEVDGRLGAGSTPAYRHAATTRLSAFFLTRYQNAFPPMSGIVAHKTIHTLKDLCEHLCERAGLETDEYDFSDFADIKLRGVVAVPPFTPRELMAALAEVFDVYFYESDKIYGRLLADAPEVALTDEDLGWVDEPPSDTETLPELDAELPAETEIPRRVTVRYFDPSRDYAQHSQHEPRTVTTGQREATFDVSLVMTDFEARAAAARRLYRADTEAVEHALALSYEYLYLDPGTTLVITRDEGFTQRVRLTEIKPTFGALECKGVQTDVALFTQPAVLPGEAFETPPVAIPGMSVLGFWDGPLLRENENSINNGAGLYVFAVKRRGAGTWTGATLYVDRGLGYELQASFDAQATTGRVVSVLTASTSTYIEVADALTVDLYSDTDTLESVSSEDLLRGANACLVGDEVCLIKTATREPDTATYPNRWYLTIGRRGLRGTEHAIDDHVADERFLLINRAVRFVPLPLAELNLERDWRLVTDGQSLDDAATVSFSWTGGTLRPLAPVAFNRVTASNDDIFVTFESRTRIGGGIRDYLINPIAEEEELFYVRVVGSSPERLVPLRRRVRGDKAVITLDTQSPSFDPDTNTGDHYLIENPLDQHTGAITARVSDLDLASAALSLRDGNTRRSVYYLLAQAGGGDSVEVYASHETSPGVLTTIDSISIPPDADGMRDVTLRIEVEDAVVKFYAVARGETAEFPFAVSTIPTTQHATLEGYLYSGLGYFLFSDVYVVTRRLTFFYRAEEQVRDFSAVVAPGALELEVWQHSALVGPGYVAEVTL